MTAPFGTRLHAAVLVRGPLCVGIDPHAAMLDEWGLPDDPGGLERFAMTVVEALAGQVAVLKPQSAFFERHGSAGIAVLERVIPAAREAGALVLLDAKRGDIGSTMQAYAQAYLDPASPLAADALTATPYLGFGSLRPLVDTALVHGAGVFVLALTSNPGGASVQQARASDGRTVAAAVLDEVAALNADTFSPLLRPAPLGSIGVVVGATLREVPANLSRLRGPVLAPGIGVQGATVADLRALFGPALPLVLPSVSRGVLRSGPSVAGLRAAADALAGQLAEA